MTVAEQANLARHASRQLALSSSRDKNLALAAMAKNLLAASSEILSANQEDVNQAQQAGISEALVDRLTLTQTRIESMASGLNQLRQIKDPIGEVVRGWTSSQGLKITQVRVPLGVVGIIYEARPNVTADAAGICLKAGNACLLRGSSSAVRSNRAIVAALRAGLVQTQLDPNIICLVEGGRETTDEMMKARGLIDVLIPRGGAGLISHVVTGSQVPVIETGTGNCHLYVDQSADQNMALEILLNAKTQRPGVCNAVETLLVHKNIAAEFVPKAIELMDTAGVVVHGDEVFQQYGQNVLPVVEEDYTTEYLALELAAKTVGSLAEAISHIQQYSSGHSETIVTKAIESAQLFSSQIDAAVVLINSSSRFVDGGEFGFGAEIGISTQKLHARGPMGVAEMTSTKFIVMGQGQVRG